MRGHRILKWLLVVAGLAIASSASAFVVLFNWADNPERWAANQVRWTWSGQPPAGVTAEAVTGALTNAFDAWQAVDCAVMTFTAGGVRATDPKNGIHVTFLTTNWDPTVGDALAYSSSTTYQNGTIASNEIVFNAADAAWTTRFPPPNGRNDIQSVAIHEIGHSLGLDHSREFTAIMFFTETNAHGGRLHADDQRGLCHLYPRSPFGAGQACDSCATHGGCASGVCFDFGDNRSFCGADCGVGLPCQEGFTCYQIDGVATPQCLPDSDHCDASGQNLPLGAPCYGHGVCASNRCLVTDREAYCSKQCQGDSDCGGGEYACLQGLCFATGAEAYGEICQSSLDCASLVCAAFTSQRARCTEDCGAGKPACPHGDRCLSTGVCVPAGQAALGDLCAGTDDCAKGYCEDGACAIPCGDGCPRGSVCEGGYCRGGAIGSACAGSSGCPSSLTCVADGTCQKLCDPLNETGCSLDERCMWLAGSGDEVQGRCELSNGGGQLYAACGAGDPCDINFLCEETATTQAACRRDCRLSDGYGCAFYEDCVVIADPSAIAPGDYDTRRGICLQPPDADPDPDLAPDAATGDATGESDTSGEPDPAPPPDKSEGCGGGRQDASLALGLGACVWVARRRARRAGVAA